MQLKFWNLRFQNQNKRYTAHLALILEHNFWLLQAIGILFGVLCRPIISLSVDFYLKNEI